MSDIKALRAQFCEQQDTMRRIFELAGPRYALSRRPVLKLLGAKDRFDALKKLKDLNKALEETAAQLSAAELADAMARFRERERALIPSTG